MQFHSGQAGDLDSRILSPCLKYLGQNHSRPQDYSLNTAQALLAVSTRKDLANGMFWGFFQSLPNEQIPKLMNYIERSSDNMSKQQISVMIAKV